MTITKADPRIQPGGRTDIGTINWIIARVSGLVTGTTPPNLFRVLGRQPKLFRGWLRFAGRLMPGGTLPRRETELVILRVAHLAGCDYELEHHTRLAARAEITAMEVARIGSGPDAPGWTGRERTILTVVDELHHNRDITDATWAAICEHLDDPTVIELVMLVTHYEMLATAIATFRIPLDRPRKHVHP